MYINKMLINEDVDTKMLKELSESDGISGCEKEVSRIVKKYIQSYSDEIFYDNLGSIIALKKGMETGPKIMLSSHIDEVGFIVKDIDKDGFIKIWPVGGWWSHVLPAQEMKITTNSGKKIVGIIGSMAPHGLASEVKEKVISIDKLYIDLGVSSREEVEILGIEIGNMITPNVEFREMNNNNFMSGKAWDDRICMGIGIDVLKQIEGEKLESNIYVAGTVQEEVGIRGARTAVHLIKPDIALALDVTTAKDTPLDTGEIKLGRGAVLSIMDSLTIGNKNLLNKMENICKDLNIKFNYDFMMVGGTDAANIHKAMEGIITMTLSVPTRYMHSSRLIVHKEDYTSSVNLIAEFCRRVNKEFIQDCKH